MVEADVLQHGFHHHLKGALIIDKQHPFAAKQGRGHGGRRGFPIRLKQGIGTDIVHNAG